MGKKLLHPNPNARAQSMREVLEHPFFGIGGLAGKVPVFNRPTLGSSDATNTVDINSYTEGHLKQRNEIVAGAEDTKLAQKKALPAVSEDDTSPFQAKDLAPSTAIHSEPQVSSSPQSATTHRPLFPSSQAAPADSPAAPKLTKNKSRRFSFKMKKKK